MGGKLKIVPQYMFRVYCGALIISIVSMILFLALFFFNFPISLLFLILSIFLYSEVYKNLVRNLRLFRVYNHKLHKPDASFNNQKEHIFSYGLYTQGFISDFYILDVKFSKMNRKRVDEVLVSKVINFEIVSQKHIVINDPGSSYLDLVISNNYELYERHLKGLSPFPTLNEIEVFTDNFSLPIVGLNTIRNVHILLKAKLNEKLNHPKFYSRDTTQNEIIHLPKIKILDINFLELDSFRELQKKKVLIERALQKNGKDNARSFEELSSMIIDFIRSYQVTSSEQSNQKVEAIFEDKSERIGRPKKVREDSSDSYRRLTKQVKSNKIYIPDNDPFFAAPKKMPTLTELLTERLSSCKTGLDFEKFIADLYKRMHFRDVEITKGSGDYGVDILAVKNDVKFAIQCKFYSSNSVGVAAVQEVISGIVYYQANRGIVVTNSNFTPSAKEMATRANIILVDGDELKRLIKNIH